MEYLRRKLCLLAGSILLTCAAWGQTLPTDSITKDPEAWYIHFKTGKSNLDLDYNGNRGTLQRCIDRVQEIIDKNEYVIDHIRIIGYASPEGPLTLNLRLSGRRIERLSCSQDRTLFQPIRSSGRRRKLERTSCHGRKKQY